MFAARALRGSRRPKWHYAALSKRTAATFNKHPTHDADDEGPEPNYTFFVPGAKKYACLPKEFPLMRGGGTLVGGRLAYETWGTLNADRTNAVLLQTGLSASSHAKSSEEDQTPGWWEGFIRPGGYIDTNKYFVICANVLGSCYGSTGPSSPNPARSDGAAYGADFPELSIQDLVRAQFSLLDGLGIQSLHAVVGSSMGGMQSLCSAVLYPDRVRRCATISACAISHPSTIAQRYAQRISIMSDPHFNNGHYYGTGQYPFVGMRNARILATISYRSGPEWMNRFALKPSKQARERAMLGVLDRQFAIEDYIHHQGDKFADRYDPNSLLYLSRAMDTFSLCDDPCTSSICDDLLAEAMRNVSMPVLVLGVQSDLLFPLFQQRQIAHVLRRAGNPHVVFYELDSIYGHDTFLLDTVNVGTALKAHLDHTPDLHH